MINEMPPPIFITGCGRSGASMIAGVINICGAFGGNMGGTNKQYENIKIRDQVINPYLKAVNADTTGQYPLPDVQNLLIPSNWAHAVERRMLEDGYFRGPWMLKGSKLALTWPVWHFSFPQAKWLIVRRRTGDILQSCIKTHFMKAFHEIENQKAIGVSNELEGWRWWVHQHEKRFVEMMTAGLNCKVIWPERMIHGDYGQMYETIEWLGLKWSSEALAFIDPKLCKARQKMVV